MINTEITAFHQISSLKPLSVSGFAGGMTPRLSQFSSPPVSSGSRCSPVRHRWRLLFNAGRAWTCWHWFNRPVAVHHRPASRVIAFVAIDLPLLFGCSVSMGVPPSITDRQSGKNSRYQRRRSWLALILFIIACRQSHWFCARRRVLVMRVFYLSK